MPGSDTNGLRNVVLKAPGIILLVLLSALFCGCQTGRRWFRMDSDSRTPTMGIELRTQQPPPAAATEARIAESATAPPQVATTAMPQAAEEKPRRLIPDWLRLNKGEEPVPLPTTRPVEANTAAASVAGPVEEFQ